MSDHVYRRQPARAFWSRSVSTNFDVADVYTGDALFRRGDRIVSLGSCFASRMRPFIEKAGFEYVSTEKPHPSFARHEEHAGYRSFSAAYGNIYTARQLRQLLERALGIFKPVEDRWFAPPYVIDPFRPGLRFKARSEREFDHLTTRHLLAVRKAFERATVVVFTLGLTEAWMSAIDGAVYPACPGTVAGVFDANRHIFKNFSVTEIEADLRAFIHMLRGLNSDARLVLTVSPVPLVATATKQHVLTATSYSKSVLRAAAGAIAETEPSVAYFPSYEIITGPQASHDFFEPDRREVSEKGVKTVMAALLACCDAQGAGDIAKVNAKPASEPTTAISAEIAAEISSRLADGECEEAMAAY